MELITPMEGPYILLGGKKLLDLSSVDFLGLAQHPEVKKGAIKYALKYGVGSIKHSTPQLEVQTKLAHYLHRESAVLFASPHDLYTQLEKIGVDVVSTESSALASLKKEKELKIVDDTYLLGITGAQGFGASTEISQMDAVCGSFLFGAGAFIAGSKQALASFTSTALSFPLLGALDCAFSCIPEMDAERKTIQKNQSWLVKQLKDFSIKTSLSPRIYLAHEYATAIRNFFLEEQIYIAPSNDATLTVSLTALHTSDDLDQLSVALKKLSTTDLALAIQSLTPTP